MRIARGGSMAGWRLLLAGAAALAVATSAQAVVATRTFLFDFDQFDSGFGSQPAPFTELAGSVTLTTDFAPDGSTQTDLTPDAINLTIGSHIFSPADVRFGRESFAKSVYLTVYGIDHGSGFQIGQNDFGIGFRYDEGLGARFGQMSYVTSTVHNNYFASKTGTVSEAPEPASWALLIVGFGGIGATLRQQRGRPARLQRVRA